MAIALRKSSEITTGIKGGGVHVMDNRVKPPEQQILGPDPMVEAESALENLKYEEDAVSNINALMLNQAMNWYQIGGTLLRIKLNGWFAKYVSFEEMTRNEFGFKKSKAYHLISIYKTLRDAGLPWNEIEGLGWPKLSLICTKAANAHYDNEQFSKILETAKTMKYVELEASLRDDLSPVAEAPPVARDHAGGARLSSDASRAIVTVEPKSAVSIPHSGEPDTVWPSMEQHFNHLLDKYDGDHDEALKEIVPAFEATFPNVVVMVALPQEADEISVED